jgi:hypothetical protein
VPLRDELARESARWVEQEIIDADQRARLLALYPDSPGASGDEGLSLGVLAIFWVGGALLFLGIAFLLSILWKDLGPLRPLLVVAIDGAFFAGGGLLLRARPGMAKTSMALLIIGGLLLPAALGVTWEELFGSSGHPLPLVALCTGVYGALAWRLRSHAFSVLFVTGLFFMGEEVVRDAEQFGALFPLVQLGLVSDLGDVFPLVFYSLASFVAGGAWLVGRAEGYAHLRPTLWVCALLLGLLPGLAGTFVRRHRELHTALVVLASLGGMGLSVVLRERKAFWVAGAGLVVALLILFGMIFEDSLAFTCFAIVLGAVILGAASYLAVKKDTWLDRLFADPAAPKPPAGPTP